MQQRNCFFSSFARRLSAYFVPLLSLLLLHLDVSIAVAQTTTLGSNLALAPNISLGCSLTPAIADFNGNFGFFPSGVNDCTWRQSGVFGVPNDSRFSSVPGDGRIVSVSVRSGPNPAPLRFSVFRQLSTPGFGAESQCCFFVSETNEVQPTANSVSTFVTNIPVQRNTINGFLAVDLFGISARTGAGTLPLVSVGPSNSFALTQLGSVNAGYFYPRLGAVVNDVGGGRREEGIPGIELAVNFTWQGVAGTGDGRGSVALLSQAVQAQGNRVPIALFCNGNSLCQGALQLLSGVRSRDAVMLSRNGFPRSRKIMKLSKKKSFRINQGASKSINSRLNKRGRKLLNQMGSITANLWVKPKNEAAQNLVLTITKTP